MWFEYEVKRHLSNNIVLTYRVDKAELSLQDDGLVSKLEEECSWFLKEKNRLQLHMATMEKDLKVSSCLRVACLPFYLPFTLVAYEISTRIHGGAEIVPRGPTEVHT